MQSIPTKILSWIGLLGSVGWVSLDYIGRWGVFMTMPETLQNIYNFIIDHQDTGYQIAPWFVMLATALTLVSVQWPHLLRFPRRSILQTSTPDALPNNAKASFQCVPTIKEASWLSPKDAFFQFSDKAWILELQRHQERTQEAWLQNEKAKRALDEIESAHAAKHKFSGPASIPPADGAYEAREKFRLTFNEYTTCVGAEKFLKGEIVKALCKQLEDGVLQAKGIAPHMMQVAQEIPSVQWTILSLDIEKAEARAENLFYAGIRISKPE